MSVQVILLLFLFWNAVWDCRKREIELVSVSVMCLAGFTMDLGRGMVIWQILAACLPAVLLLAASLLSKGAVGFGDGLIFLAAGLWTGAVSSFLLLFLSLAAASAVSFVMILHGKRKAEIPLVPFVLSMQLLLILLGTTGDRAIGY